MSAARVQSRAEDGDIEHSAAKRQRLSTADGDQGNAQRMLPLLLASLNETEIRQGLACCTDDSLSVWSDALVHLLYAPISYALKRDVITKFAPLVNRLSTKERRRVVDATCVLYTIAELAPSLVVSVLQQAEFTQVECILDVICEWLSSQDKARLLGAFDLIHMYTNHTKMMSDEMSWRVLLTMSHDEDTELMGRACETTEHVLSMRTRETLYKWPDAWTRILLTFLSGTPKHDKRRIVTVKFLTRASLANLSMPDTLQYPLLKALTDILSLNSLLYKYCEHQLRHSPAFRTYALTCPCMTSLLLQWKEIDRIALVAIRFRCATDEEASSIGVDEVALALSGSEFKSTVTCASLEVCIDMARLVHLSPACTERWIDFALQFVKDKECNIPYKNCQHLAAGSIGMALARHALTPAQVTTLRETVLCMLEEATHSEFSLRLAPLLPILMQRPHETGIDAAARRACACAAVLAHYGIAAILPLMWAYMTNPINRVCRAAFNLAHQLREHVPRFSLSHLCQESGPFATEKAVHVLLKRAPSEFCSLIFKFFHDGGAAQFSIMHHSVIVTPVVFLLLQPPTKRALSLDDTFHLSYSLTQLLACQQELPSPPMKLVCATMVGIVGALARFPDDARLQRHAVTALTIECNSPHFSYRSAHSLHPYVRRLIDIPNMVHSMEATVRNDIVPESGLYQVRFALLLRDHIYGRVDDDVFAAAVRQRLNPLLPCSRGGGSGCIAPPLYLRHVYVEPAWFGERMTTLMQLVPDDDDNDDSESEDDNNESESEDNDEQADESEDD
jgi:hypothetical protein